MKREQKLTLKGLAHIRNNSMEQEFKLPNVTDRESKSHINLVQASRQHYSRRLKYPISLKRDPLWAQEKVYLKKFHLYIKRKLPVEYIYFNNGKQFLEGHSQPLTMEQPNPQRDDTFDNFDQNKFLKVPTDRFYNEHLEHKFYVRELKRNRVKMLTQPVEQTYEDKYQDKRELSPIYQLKRKYNSIKGALQPLVRNRSLTSSIQIDGIRDRRLTKISKQSVMTKQQISVLKEDIALDLDYDSAVRKLREVMEVGPQQPILKQQVLKKLYQKYGIYPQHVPLRCNRLDEYLHLKTTIQSINNISNYTVQKLAFDFYDFNRNNVIDEEDLFHMLQRGLEMPAIDRDYQLIIEYLRRLDNKVRDVPISSPKKSPSGLSPKLRLSRLSRISIPTRTQETHNSKAQAKKVSPQIWTLHKRQSQSPDFKRPPLPPIQPVGSKQITINFARFQSIFSFKRPEIFYDIISYLFGFQKKTPSKNIRMPRHTRFNNSSKRSHRQHNQIQVQPFSCNFPNIQIIKSRIKQLRSEALKPIAQI